MRLAAAWFTAALAVATANCASRVDEPPTIRYGESACSHCGMIINEARYAAAARGPDGQAVMFDDLICLLRHQAQHPAAAPQRLWVHDYYTEAWVEAERATFVRSRQLATSMGSGLAAVARFEDAGRLAQEQSGEMVSLDAVKAAIRGGE